MTIHLTQDARWAPAGALNWRDVGGLPTADGRSVRTGRLFRSDALGQLDADDVRAVRDGLGVGLVLDLRYRDESATEGSGLLGRSGVPHHNLPFVGRWGEKPGFRLPERADPNLVAFYLSILEESPDSVVRALTLVADPDAPPAVVHCAAGKDRTGVFVALALSAVGVPDDEVAAEYACSATSVPAVLGRLARRPTYAADPAGLAPHRNRTDPETMRGFLAGLHLRHGSVPRYLSVAGAPPGLVERLSAALTG